MKLAIVANSAWYLQNFRLNLALHLRAQGHEPVFIGAPDGHEASLCQQGFTFHPWQLSAAGIQPWAELRAVLALRRLLRQTGVTAVLSYTPKGNLYSGLALGRSQVRWLANVSGLGRAFIEPGLLLRAVPLLYRLALRHAHTVVFQNEDDREHFLRLGLVARERTLRVPGSGVDLQRFQPGPSSDPSGPARRFLMVARLLRDKGVHEFVAAARRIRAERSDCEFVLLGSSRSPNPSAVDVATLAAWLAEGAVQHIEQVDDVRPELTRADCVVLPSYREGVPRSLLEAAAMGKPLIASDVPGCRDAVRPGLNGLLCPARDAAALEQALRQMLAATPERLRQMGQAGRTLMEREFDESLVLATYTRLLSANAC